MFVQLVFGIAGLITLSLIYVAFVVLPARMYWAYRGAFEALAMAVEEREPGTAGHSTRVSRFSVMLGKRFGLRRKDLMTLEYAALLHDIGKVSIPYTILNFNGPRDTKQKQLMARHAHEGGNMLLEANTIQEDKLICMSRIVDHHHDRYDSLRQMRGTLNDKVLLQIQILTVANDLDAMLYGTNRTEKLSLKEALKILQKGSGTFYSPQVVNDVIKVASKRFPQTQSEQRQTESIR